MKQNDQADSEPLTEVIIGMILNYPNQSITFRDFMEQCLYHPRYGYYCRADSKIGKNGDFYTSSDIGSIMGEILAKFIIGLSGSTSGITPDGITIVEWGGGTGKLACQILDEIKTSYPNQYDAVEYIVVEQSGSFRTAQGISLESHAAAVRIMAPEEWFEQSRKDGAVLISNELIDAFPVHRVKFGEGRLLENYVSWDSAGKIFYEKWLVCENPHLIQYIKDNHIFLQEGQQIEVNLEALGWMERIGGQMDSGHVITIDYGDVSEEIHAEQRMLGTLMCYRKHQAHNDPYSFIGTQDITSHVNFSALIHRGRTVGFQEWKLQTQKDFLIQEGILDKLQDHSFTDPFHPAARKNRAIRQLLISDRMSELFKVLVQTKKASSG